MTARRWAGAVLAAGLALLAALTLLPTDAGDLGDVMLAFGLLTPVGLATVAGAELLAARRRRAPSLRRQFGLLGLLSCLQLAAAAALFVTVMFLSRHDGVLTLVLVAYAVALAVWAARLLAAGPMADLEAIRHALAAVAAGRRDVRAGIAGRDELARLGADVDAMIGRLDVEERARRELMTAVSHDLRTPITALGLLAQAIRDGIVDEETRQQYAARMTTHVQALAGLIDDLFELTQVQRGELGSPREDVDLGMLVREAVEAMRPAAEARGVGLWVAPADGPAAVHGSAEKLQRVLFNLLQNAIRHTPAGGGVTVGVRAGDRGDTVELRVADTGGGIAPGDRERVFEPFFRGGTDAPRTDGGAGLGLAISRAIVEAHRGWIGVADAEPGTLVTVGLPRAGEGAQTDVPKTS